MMCIFKFAEKTLVLERSTCVSTEIFFGGEITFLPNAMHFPWVNLMQKFAFFFHFAAKVVLEQTVVQGLRGPLV